MNIKGLKITLNIILALTLAILIAGCSEQQKKSAVLENAYGTIKRTVPGIEKHFILEELPNELDKDVFELESDKQKIIIRGTSGVALASGFNYYLKNFCNIHISWCGNQVEVPEKLPMIKEKIRIVSPYQYRYCFNYVSFGYTMAFWDWQRWEKQIDWMAMQGINMPLALTGHEAVIMTVYKKLGLTNEEVKSFVSGPPYLPFFMMGLLDGFGGPLPDSWFEEQQELQKKILERERALGMKPVLPVFTGHVPNSLFQYYPDMQTMIVKGINWKGTHLLLPEDKLFQKIGNMLIDETKKLYGSDHLYSADVFMEMTPPSGDTSYLKNSARAVYSSMSTSDPDAIWVMQAWLWVTLKGWWTPERSVALLEGVPDDKMILLDLFSTAKPVWNRKETFGEEPFGGKPWIWNMLHNWGGKQGMYGRAHTMVEDLPSLTQKEESGDLMGIGIMPEGLENNPVMYDLFGSLVWENETVDLESWTRNYVIRRYGADNYYLQKAWNILINTIYSCQTKRHGPQGSYFAMRPTLDFSEGRWVRANIFYDPEDVKNALSYFLQASDKFANSETFRYDLTDLTRQAMSDWSQSMHGELALAFKNKEIQEFRKKSKKYLFAILDLDTLLSSKPLFTVSHYLYHARNRANSAHQAKLYEWNARNIITQWGAKNTVLNNYAQRQYSGLMRDLYYPRWKVFFEDAVKSLEQNSELNDSTILKISDLEDDWVKSQKEYTGKNNQNYVSVARKIYKTYLK